MLVDDKKIRSILNSVVAGSEGWSVRGSVMSWLLSRRLVMMKRDGK